MANRPGTHLGVFDLAAGKLFEPIERFSDQTEARRYGSSRLSQMYRSGVAAIGT